MAVHLDVFRSDLTEAEIGIEELINRRTGQNRFSNSNYRGFPYLDGNNEPCGMCYRVANQAALTQLLSRLSGRTEQPHQRSSAPQTSEASRSTALRPSRATPQLIDAGLIIREPFVTEILSGRLIYVLPVQSESEMIENLARHRIPFDRLASGETAKWRIP